MITGLFDGIILVIMLLATLCMTFITIDILGKTSSCLLLDRLIKRLFCRHNYTILGKLDCHFTTENNTKLYLPITLYECKLCGHRKTDKDQSFFYRRELLQMIKLWEKQQLDTDLLLRNSD